MARHRSFLRPMAVAALLALATAGTGLTGIGGAASAASTGGCGKAPLRSGNFSAQINGQNRTYILRVPDSYDMNHPYRFIIGYHWRGGTANDVSSGGTDGALWSYYGMQRQGGSNTIFVAPQGLGNGWANSGGEDLAFTDAIVKTVEDGLCVDTTQLFALGFSYGGGMSYAIACARANVFRAVTVYSGANLSGCNGGTQPIGYLGIHGVSDGTLNISNGRSLRDTFVKANGCTPQSPPEPRAGSLTHIATVYSGCRAGYPVVWAAFDGGHGPAPIDGASGDSGARSWTPAYVWAFFTQFASGGGSTTTTTTTTRPTTTTSSTTTSGTTSTTSTTAQSTSTTTGGGDGGGCTAVGTPNQWTGGFVVNVVVSASGSIHGWRVSLNLPGGAAFSNGWSATFAGSTGTITATNMSYNGNVTSGQPQSFGFQGTGTVSGLTASCTVLS